MPSVVPTGAVDGTNRVFTLPFIPVGDSFLVADRLIEDAVLDYTLAGNVITFLPAAYPAPPSAVAGAPPPGTSLRFFYNNGLPLVAGAYSGDDTVAHIISDAAVELGIMPANAPATSGDVPDPFASQDANILQLLRLLKTMGREITRARQWTFLQTEYSFQTVQGQTLYPLPGDFRTMLDQTGWNRTSRFPLGGPMSPQEWQYLKAVPAPATITILFRPRDRQIELYPAPGAASQLIAFEYLTSSWLAVNGTFTPAKDAPTLGSDVVLFDSLLMVRALKLAWRREKGLDSTAAQQDYDASMEMVQGDDAQAPVLRIDGRGSLRTRLLDPDLSVPPTGWGGGT